MRIARVLLPALSHSEAAGTGTAPRASLYASGPAVAAQVVERTVGFGPVGAAVVDACLDRGEEPLAQGAVAPLVVQHHQADIVVDGT